MFGLLMVFQDVPAKGVLGSEFVGFEHFRYLFSLLDIFLVTKKHDFYRFLEIIFNRWS